MELMLILTQEEKDVPIKTTGCRSFNLIMCQIHFSLVAKTLAIQILIGTLRNFAVFKYLKDIMVHGYGSILEEATIFSDIHISTYFGDKMLLTFVVTKKLF